MSGEKAGNCEKEKQEDDLQSPIQQTDGAYSSQTLATLQRPHILQSSAGEKSSIPRNLSDQEKRVGEQAFELLKRFVLESAKQDDNLDSTQRSQIQNAICPDVQQEMPQPSQSDEDIIVMAMVCIQFGDKMNQNCNLKRLIDNVAADATKETFIKVCGQVFSDGVFNWGRVVTLFFLAYRLIAKVAVAVDTIPLIKEIFTWAIDFFVENMLLWVIKQGGWKTICEYLGTPFKTLAALSVLAAVCTLYVLWKQQ